MEAYANMANEQKINEMILMAGRMREKALTLALSAGNKGAHIGPTLSIIEIMATLYGGVLNLDPKNPTWSDRDRFLLSKGHGALGLYVALAEAGFITSEELDTFEENDGFLPGQPTMNVEKGIEISSGSLGLGLSIGIGMALIGKQLKKKYRVYVLMGDGECNEGSVWEAAMAASHFKLNNLIAIIDYNKMQSDGKSKMIMDMDDLGLKWKSFGWEVTEVDGHNIFDLYKAFSSDTFSLNKPYLVLANTTKGKGVSFMENNKDWHHNRLTAQQYGLAMSELKIQ